jgi:hypothetical protein
MYCVQWCEADTVITLDNTFLLDDDFSHPAIEFRPRHPYVYKPDSDSLVAATAAVLSHRPRHRVTIGTHLTRMYTPVLPMRFFWRPPRCRHVLRLLERLD